MEQKLASAIDLFPDETSLRLLLSLSRPRLWSSNNRGASHLSTVPVRAQSRPTLNDGEDGDERARRSLALSGFYELQDPGVVVVGIAPDHLFDEQASKIRIQSFSLIVCVKPA